MFPISPKTVALSTAPACEAREVRAPKKLKCTSWHRFQSTQNGTHKPQFLGTVELFSQKFNLCLFLLASKLCCFLLLHPLLNCEEIGTAISHLRQGTTRFSPTEYERRGAGGKNPAYVLWSCAHHVQLLSPLLFRFGE